MTLQISKFRRTYGWENILVAISSALNSLQAYFCLLWILSLITFAKFGKLFLILPSIPLICH